MSPLAAGNSTSDPSLSVSAAAGAAAKRQHSDQSASASDGGGAGSGHNDDGSSSNRRSAASNAHHHRVGPKRKSKVGISGLADQSHFGHAGHARRKNASSSHLSRHNKSKSHLALTHVASELAGLAQIQDVAPGMTRTSSKSKERKAKSQHARDETEAVADTDMAQHQHQASEADGDENEAGWVSATSSAAATPLAGTSPISPESYKALEFGKKARRKKNAAGSIQQQVQPLDFPKYDQRQSLQRTATEDEDTMGTTPRQRESALSLGAPKNLASSSNLSQLASLSTNATTSTDDTLVSKESATTQQTLNDDESRPSTTTAPLSKDQLENIPSRPEPVSRPSTMRKTSTSTIRSLASIGGTRPLSASIRRQTMTPLQPRLDTSVEGLGELKHVGLTPKQNDVAFPSEAAATTAQSRARHRRQHSGGSLGHAPSSSKAGTLSPKEAEELAKRLRTVSGSDIPPAPPSASSGEPDFGQYPVRGTLRRSASTAQGTTLASLQKYGISSPKNEYPSSGGGALGTLKRASGYFGSISRLTSLGSTLGLTSLDSSSKDGHVPSPTSPAARRTPSSGGSLQAQQSSTSPMQRLQGAYGLRGSRNTQSPQVRQPLISKFIDPSESYQPFPKASASPTTINSQSSKQQHPGLQRGGTSRARQKLLTQRDYPDDFGTQSQDGSLAGSGGMSAISDEDPMASQVNLRKNLSSKNLSGTTTPLQPGVQRWLVALSKEAERIDRDHETFFRFHDTMQASFARILERRAVLEQEEIKAWKEKNQTKT